MKSNLTLTISNWTRDVIKHAYGIDAQVVYPPVVFTCNLTPWAQRKNEFVCVGRIEPDKNIESIIKILQEVRHHGYDIKLSIVGALAPNLQGYADRLIKKYSAGEDWILVEKDPSRRDLENKIANSRYGIHGRENEHFGISVAELVKGGCIPFIPKSGGQVEILNNSPDLLYENPGDAVGKIIRVLKSERLRSSILTDLSHQAVKFSKEKFQVEILNAVDEFCSEKCEQANLHNNVPGTMLPAI